MLFYRWQMCPVKMTPRDCHLGAVQRHNYLRLCEPIRQGGHIAFISCHLQFIGNATCSVVLMKILRPDSSSVVITVHHSCGKGKRGHWSQYLPLLIQRAEMEFSPLEIQAPMYQK